MNVTSTLAKLELQRRAFPSWSLGTRWLSTRDCPRKLLLPTKSAMSRTRYRIFETEYPYFLTSTIVGWLPLFTRREAVEIVFEAWRYHQRESGLQIFGYVVLENHLHWIARAPELSKVIQSFKKLHRSTDHRPARTKLRRRAGAATANTQARTQGGKRLPSLAGGKQTKAASERRDAVAEAGMHAQQSG